MIVNITSKGFLLFLSVLVFEYANCLFNTEVYARTLQTSPSKFAFEKYLVEVTVFGLRQHADAPWIFKNLEPQRKVGVYISPNVILITSHHIMEKSSFQIRSATDFEYHSAQLFALDRSLNLALLKVDKRENIFDNNKKEQQEFAEDPQLDTEAVMVDLTQNLSVMMINSTMRRVKSNSDGKGNYYPMHYYESKSKMISSEGPVFCGRKLCGLINDKVSKASNEYRVIPSSMLKKFYLSHQKQTAQQRISQGFRLIELFDPARRKYYQLPKDISGALVTNVYIGTSAYNHLKVHDIIISIDGKNVDNFGYYNDDQYGRLYSPLLFLYDDAKTRSISDTIPVEVWRNNKLELINILLQPDSGTSERIPLDWVSHNYVLENGILFVEFSRRLLEDKYGRQWQKLSVLASHIYFTQRFYEEFSEDRIVVIANVYPDEANEYIENIQMLPIVSINGEKIMNLTDFYSKIQLCIKQGDEFVYVDLFGNYRVYLDLKNRNVINKRLQQRYDIYKFHSLEEL